MEKNELKNSGTNTKKPFYKKWWFWVIIIIILGAIGSNMSDSEKNTQDNSQSTQQEATQNTQPVAEQKEKKEQKEETKQNSDDSSNSDSKEQTIYDKNNILIQVKDYEYHSVMGYLDIKLYIENNTKEDLTFTMDGDVTINDTSLSSGFYEDINHGTKKNVTISIYDLEENNIKENELSVLKFKLDIYNPDNFITKGKLEEGFKFKYKFK